MRFPSSVANGEWGARGQLKVRRHSKFLEVYADIAYAAAGQSHRSIQGLVVCYAGVPVAWQCNQQPFVTHSTAEAELVSYCEALLAGRASEALLCAIWGEEINSNSFERVMYGDNAAAIGLAHGVTASSWRTRHLRIRSSILKEALQENSEVPGGKWQLIHLKGTELVADGCTKPLNGQAFFRFLEDLGLKRGLQAEEVRGATSTDDEPGDDGRGAAILALTAGSLLLSGVDGEYETEEDLDTSAIWATGAILMALGAIYAGQVIYGVASCCLRRLKAADGGNSFRLDARENPNEEVSENEATVGGERLQRGTSSSSLRQRSGTSIGSTSSKGMTSSSATKRGAQSASMQTSSSQEVVCDSCGAGATMSRSLRPQSGSSDGDGELDLSLTLRRRSGSSKAAGEPAASQSTAAAAVDSVGSAVDQGSKGGSKKAMATNPWNQYQHEHKGKGLNSTSLAQMYKREKEQAPNS